ncbi:MAG: hypothetical protein OXT74_00845 [Candidatus Poribacteria bacterium]|nr:hypothetical protein [Candidatus Poribacteria bacterium]
MSRSEAIQRIVWCLLNHTEQPEIAVATVETLISSLGEGYEGQMTLTNLLRAAGLFAKDDDGYFMRYRREEAIADESLLTLPSPNYLITFPVPTEPRMRIAYSVFSGLLLKYVYQVYGAVPITVREGIAHLWLPNPISENAESLWEKFRRSNMIYQALKDGLPSSLDAAKQESPRGIGAISVTEIMTQSQLLAVLVNSVIETEEIFQDNGGKRLHYYNKVDVQRWLEEEATLTDTDFDELWREGLTRSNSVQEIGKRLAACVVLVNTQTPIMAVRDFGQAWRQKRGPRGSDREQREQIKKITEVAMRVTGKLDTQRKGISDLHQFVEQALMNEFAFLEEIKKAKQRIEIILSSDNESAAASTPIDLSAFCTKLETDLMQNVVITKINNVEPRAAIKESVKACFCCGLARALDWNSNVIVFGWQADTLRIFEGKKATMRFINKRKSTKGKKAFDVILDTRIRRDREVPEIDHIDVLKNALEPDLNSPFNLLTINGFPQSTTSITVQTENRCMVCGISSQNELLKGAKSFLPETKKRHYDIPSRTPVEPQICSNCAFIAYLSSVYPSSGLSIVEFPVDNFLELFALYESLQGVSALKALKYVNRVASLSVLPNRYLLLSQRDGRGKMDGKTQLCLQLREQAHLIKDINRPMRVQIEGSTPHMWSEIAPHVPVGLSHFKELPPYFETKSARKGFAYDVVRALQTGQPYKAFYAAAKYATDRGHPFERRVFTKNRKDYESYIIDHCHELAKSLGGETVKDDIYQDITDFSDYLFDLLHPLVRREVQKSKSAVSGVSRKYTDRISRDFSEGLTSKFLYTVCQEANSAERHGEWWVKDKTFTTLYGDSSPRGKTAEETARAWDEFRQSHSVRIEVDLAKYRCRHGGQFVIWQRFLREVQARTLGLLMLNVKHSS